MTTNSQIDYHLRELQIAATPESVDYAMPTFLDSDKAILDIGCGIGQTLVTGVGRSQKLLVGVDIDLSSQKYGHDKFDYVSFANAVAEDLPFADKTFDLVVSRVTLPYTKIPCALLEINRILIPGGRVWLTLHTFEKTWTRWKRAFSSFNIKDIVYCGYVTLNGLLFAFSGRLIAWPISGRFESFQNRFGMLKAMRKAGFCDIAVKMQGKSLVCTACKRVGTSVDTAMHNAALHSG